MGTRRAAAASLVLTVGLLAACTEAAPPESQPSSAETASASDAAPTDPTATGASEDSAAPDASPVEVVGAAQPTVRWPAVDGAASYRVTVLQDDGPAWAWEGEVTEVVLGGGTQDGGGRGFRLTSGAVLTVSAHGPDGEVLRLDQRRVDAPAG